MDNRENKFSLSADLIYENNSRISNPIQQSTAPSCSTFQITEEVDKPINTIIKQHTTVRQHTTTKQLQEKLFMNKSETNGEVDETDSPDSPRIILPKTCCQTFKIGLIHNLVHMINCIGTKR